MSEFHKCENCGFRCDCLMRDGECEECSVCYEIENEREANDLEFQEVLRQAITSPPAKILHENETVRILNGEEFV